MEYEKIVKIVKKLPMTWYPAIIIEIIESAIDKGVFKKDKAHIFVKNIEKRHGAKTK